MNEIIIVILSTVIPTFIVTVANIIITLIKMKNEQSAVKRKEQTIFNEQEIEAIRIFALSVQEQYVSYICGLGYNFTYCINKFLPYCPSDLADTLKTVSSMKMSEENFELISNELDAIIETLTASMPSLNPANLYNPKYIKK